MKRRRGEFFKISCGVALFRQQGPCQVSTGLSHSIQNNVVMLLRLLQPSSNDSTDFKIRQSPSPQVISYQVDGMIGRLWSMLAHFIHSAYSTAMLIRKVRCFSRYSRAHYKLRYDYI